MPRAARSTVKSHRHKLARFSATTVYVSVKPGKKFMFRPHSAVLSDFNPAEVRQVRAGSALVPR